MSVTLMAVLVVFSLALAGFLAAAEAAYLYLPRKEAEQLVAKDPKGALSKVLENPRWHTDALRFWRIWFEFISAVLATALFIKAIDRLWLALLIAVLVMAVVSAFLVTVSPRQLGRRYDHQLVKASAPLVHFLRMILGPLPKWLKALGEKVASQSVEHEKVFFAEEHFMEFVTRASEADVIEDSEVELIQSVVDLSDTRVRAVMVPRTDMITVDTGTNLNDTMSLFLRSGNSRIPVIGEDADDVRGVVYLKDAAALLFNSDHEAGQRLTVEDIQREISFIPESKQVSELLELMQRETIHVAIVVDEYGGTAGLVTLEDLIEEIVGEIVDEYDDERPEVEHLENNVMRLATSMSKDDFQEMFDLNLESEEFEDVDTLGGLFATVLGRVPIVGSEVEVENLHLVAERIQGRRNRISHVVVTIHPREQDSEDQQEARHEYH